MRTVAADHWLRGAARLPSPNADCRPDPQDVSLVVLHGISLPPGRFDTGLVEALFTNTLDVARHPALADLADARVSSHLLVSRRGRVTQFVPFHRRAWHAGVSSYGGRTGCNAFSIGIELEGTDGHAVHGLAVPAVGGGRCRADAALPGVVAVAHRRPR